jgi:transposase
MLAECIDAVIGVDTHRDTHHAEIAHPSGAVIAACSVPSISAGYAQLLAWAREHAPGPRLVISIEGTRSYGAGLARTAAAAGLMVTECEQPTRGKGKSDPSTRTWPCWPLCSWTPRSWPSPARTGTARHCASCCAHGPS